MSNYSPRYMTDAEREMLWDSLIPKYRLVCEISYYMGFRVIILQGLSLGLMS